MSLRRHIIKDFDGNEWEVTVEVTAHDADGFPARLTNLRDVIPGPALKQLRDQLRDDVEELL